MAPLRVCLLALVVTTAQAGFLQASNATSAVINQEHSKETIEKTSSGTEDFEKLSERVAALQNGAVKVEEDERKRSKEVDEARRVAKDAEDARLAEEKRRKQARIEKQQLEASLSLAQQLEASWKKSEATVDDKHLSDSLKGTEVANAQPNSSYSTHACHGGPGGTTCGFQNVCYDLVSDRGKLVYFTQNLDALVTDLDLRAHMRPLLDIDLRPLSQMANSAVKLGIQVVRGPIPAEAAIYPHAVTVLFQPFGSENFGHELGDDMYAAFVMQQLFRIADPYNSQLLTLDSCDRPERDGGKRAGCVGMMAKLYPALSRHPVLQMRAMDLLRTDGETLYQSFIRTAAAHQKPKFMCFPLLLAGSGQYSFRSPIVSGHSYFAYRSFLLHNLCPNGACAGVALERKTILIAKKTTFSKTGMGAGIPNTKGLQEHLRHSFPKYDVQLQDLALISFKDQAALLARTSVMFSHCGGGSFSALFLPPGAALAITTKEEKHKPIMAYWVKKEVHFWESLKWLSFHNLEQQDLTPALAQQIVVHTLGKHKANVREGVDFWDITSWMTDHMKDVEAMEGRGLSEKEIEAIKSEKVDETEAIPEKSKKTDVSLFQVENATELGDDVKIGDYDELMGETEDSSEDVDEDEQAEEEGSELSDKEEDGSELSDKSEKGDETEAIQE